MYIVKDIIEPDFGCEGLPDGEELCCEVILEDPDTGARLTVKAPDGELYEKGIEIGSLVTYDRRAAGAEPALPNSRCQTE